MYVSKEAQLTLNARYMTPYHKQAQWAEFCELKKAIGEIFNECNHPLRVFDIGIGTARVPAWLSTVATWDKIANYTGIDIAPFCVAQSKRIATLMKIADKVEVVKSDATNLNINYKEFLKGGEYDLVICTYFTAGDFQPGEIKLQTRKNGLIVDYDVDVLRPNRKFISVFKGAYELLHGGGRIIIGSIYSDNDFTRRIQEEFYKRCNMTVITSDKDQFAATKEGFWSERFDRNKIYSYFPWVPIREVRLIPLDDYDFASMVSVKK
jgi:hypothetical protein